MIHAAPPKVLARRAADAILALPDRPGRRLIAIAGPPGAGKSTIAAAIRDALMGRGVATGILAMDGFHYDNAVLEARGLLAVKGAPSTFDVAGLRNCLSRLVTEGEVAVPAFDRALDKAIAARSVVAASERLVLVEGNYLLLDEPGWVDLRQFWAFSIFLDVPRDELEARLTKRWLDHGLTHDQAQERAWSNDLPNAERVLRGSVGADLTLA